jgi:trigger factor
LQALAGDFHPVDVVESETSRVVDDIQKRANCRAFARQSARQPDPQAICRRYTAEGAGESDPRPSAEAAGCGEPERGGHAEISDVHFHDFAPLKFKATFEVFPEVALGEYNNVEVPYQDPEVTEEDIAKRIDEIREQKAQYINIDPRPVVDGDFAVVSLESLEGVVGEPVKTDETVLEIGAKETFEAFTENIRGLTPGDEKDFEVALPGGLWVRETCR